MDQKTIARLEEFEKSKQYYDALQFFRTKVTRSFRLKNASETAIPLIRHALDYFLKEKQYQCAIDIITLFSESLSKNNTPQNEQIFALLAEAAAKLAEIAETEISNNNLKEEELVASARRRFAEISLQWTKSQASNPWEKKFGSSQLHYYLANRYLQVNAIELARNHFLLSDHPKEFAKFLYTAWQTNGIESEFDLIIVQAVLQLLCIDRYPFARELFNQYVQLSNTKNAPFNQPLLNFLDILFNVISAVNVSQFSVIMELYLSEILRDVTFKGYLAKIGKMYFNIRDAQPSGGGLAGLLTGMMGNENQEEMATSHLSPSVQKAGVINPPKPTIQAARAQPAPTAMEVDDLD